MSSFMAIPPTSLRFSLIAMALVLIGGVAVFEFASHRQSPAERGALVYAANCASCHGDTLQGQPDWRHLNVQGRLPAPPLNGTGHAWRHSNAELLHIVKFSVLDQAGPDYKTDMPAFDGKLPDQDILAILAYVHDSWPSGVQAAQSFLNPGHAGMPAKVDGDWRLPADCDEPVRGKPSVLPTQ